MLGLVQNQITAAGAASSRGIDDPLRISFSMAAPKHPTKKVKDLSAMSIDELWALHETVAVTLVAKMTAEKRVIEDRLRLLDRARSDANENNRAG